MAEITQEFINLAKEMQDKTGIPASITLAQLIKESSGRYPGGLSGLAYNDKNLFGVKGKGSAGSSYYPTKEFVSGQYVTVNAAFRKYNSYADAFNDRASFLSGPRYQKAFKDAKSVNDYAQGLQNAGYATDPNYANGLLKVINQYNLHQYDSGKFAYTPVAGGSSGSSSSGSTSTGGGESTSDSKGFAGDLMFSINRIILVLLFLIIGVIFFMKAFPATEGVANMATSAVNPVKKIKTVKKVAKAVAK